MSYMYGIVPTLGETLAKKPLKFAKWAMFFEALNGAGANLSPGTNVEKTTKPYDRGAGRSYVRYGLHAKNNSQASRSNLSTVKR